MIGTRRGFIRARAERSDALARHRFAALVDGLAEKASFVARPMFGCVGCYLDGRLVVVLADRADPWQGLLLPTERGLHAELLREFGALRVHPVLGKWLYLPYGSDEFPVTADVIVDRIANGDPRFGVESSARKLPRRGAGCRRGTRRQQSR